MKISEMLKNVGTTAVYIAELMHSNGYIDKEEWDFDYADICFDDGMLVLNFSHTSWTETHSENIPFSILNRTDDGKEEWIICIILKREQAQRKLAEERQAKKRQAKKDSDKDRYNHYLRLKKEFGD